MRRIESLVLALCLATGCTLDGGPEPAEPELGSRKEAIVSGLRLPAPRPEIARFFRAGEGTCAATLVHERYLVTAGRCINRTDPTDQIVRRDDAVTFTRADGTTERFTLDRIHRFDDATGRILWTGHRPDVAVLSLSRPVPASTARPLTIDWRPADETMSTMWSTRYGFGCTNRTTGAGGGTLRRYPFTGHLSNVFCPGDEGGPVLFGDDGSTNRIWGLASDNRDGRDRDGDVASFKPDILALIEARDGDGTLLPGVDLYGSDIAVRSVASAAACKSACEGEYLCQSFTFAPPPTTGGSGTCWLKDTIPGFRPASGLTSGINHNHAGAHVHGLSWGYDRYGEDYRVLEVRYPLDCGRACARDARCQSFTIGRHDAGYTCYLKDRRPDPVYRNTTTLASAVKLGIRYDLEVLGHTYLTTGYSVKTAEVCQSSCASDDHCVAWTSSPAIGGGTVCFLKDSVTGTRRHYGSGLVSGFRGDEFI